MSNNNKIEDSHDIKLYKLQAKILKTFLEKGNMNISYSSCLEVIALMNGYKGWSQLVGLENKKE